MIVVLVEWPTAIKGNNNRDWALFEDDEINQAEDQYESWRGHPNSLVTHYFHYEEYLPEDTYAECGEVD